METLCSRFYAVISGTSGGIGMGSSGEGLEWKNWQFIFFALSDLFLDLHLWPWMNASTIWFFGCYWIGMDKEYSKKLQGDRFHGHLPFHWVQWGYSARWPSECRISKAFYCYLNFILLSLPVKWHADMMSSYWNISTKPTAQSFHFDCRLCYEQSASLFPIYSITCQVMKSRKS